MWICKTSSLKRKQNVDSYIMESYNQSKYLLLDDTANDDYKNVRVRLIYMMKMDNNSVAVLTKNHRYSLFQFEDVCIKFKSSPFLVRYNSVEKWNDGYIECMAKYSTLDEPVEEYIDLRYIAKRLELSDDIFHGIKEVVVR